MLLGKVTSNKRFIISNPLDWSLRLDNRLCKKSYLLEPIKATQPMSISRYFSSKGQSSAYFKVYQDTTLIWAQANPQLAQECLNPPQQHDLQQCNPNLDPYKIESLEAFLEWRRWPFPNEITNITEEGGHSLTAKTNAVALVSHVLSAPLTLASQIRSIIAAKDNGKYHKKTIELSWQWCCIGARAEATLPPIYWQEFLFLSSRLFLDESQTKKYRLDVLLEFTGPDIPPNFHDQKLSISSSTSKSSSGDNSESDYITITGGYRGLYHEKHATIEPTTDAFLFFNPGFGHPNLKTSWKATLEKILLQDPETPLASTNRKQRVLLFTAHSEKDAKRDTRFLKEIYGLNIEYTLNPFASRIMYQDPFDEGHTVCPNKYVALISI